MACLRASFVLEKRLGFLYDNQKANTIVIAAKFDQTSLQRASCFAQKKAVAGRIFKWLLVIGWMLPSI